jgi:hypothetical protein|tara:strand:+ start:3865 stop:4203 length:339 start_codon:yes stop_codon:yes gene_type:complete
MIDVKDEDDNPEVIDLIEERMALGLDRYGHGLRRGDDTRQWGTKANSWTEMALEEALDLTVYLCAQLLRIRAAEDECPNCSPRLIQIEPERTMTEPVKRVGLLTRIARWFRR